MTMNGSANGHAATVTGEVVAAEANRRPQPTRPPTPPSGHRLAPAAAPSADDLDPGYRSDVEDVELLATRTGPVFSQIMSPDQGSSEFTVDRCVDDHGREQWAVWDEYRRYRYGLGVPLNGAGPRLVVVGLCPDGSVASTLDVEAERAATFGNRAGCSSVEIVSLFARLGSRTVTDLGRVDDPVGAGNQRALEAALAHRPDEVAPLIIAAWGGSFPAGFLPHVREVRGDLVLRGAMVLGWTSGGHPRRVTGGLGPHPELELLGAR